MMKIVVKYPEIFSSSSKNAILSFSNSGSNDYNKVSVLPITLYYSLKSCCSIRNTNVCEIILHELAKQSYSVVSAVMQIAVSKMMTH